MRVKKQKRHRKAFRFYTACFGFREPFKVLCDGTFVHHLLLNKITPADTALANALGAPVKIFTTRCVLGELRSLGDSYAESLNAARNLLTARCDHEKQKSAISCITDIIGENNSEHFFVATQDVELQKKFQKDHIRYLAEHEYKALKERIAGTRLGFKKVSCINATLPWSHVATISDDICKSYKFSKGQEERVVVGTLDLNQCIKLPDEITGMKPKGIGADFARAYLSNVCVARELRRNGLGYDVIAKAKIVARNWGISDLYVHVAVDNEPAKNLYL